MQPPVNLNDLAVRLRRHVEALARTPRVPTTPDTLDYPFLAKVTAGVCAAVGRFLVY